MIARKRFGQHFLRDAEVLSEIVQCIAPQADDALLEIGPGQGALTQAILAVQRVRQFYAIEIDRDLLPRLRRVFAKEVEVIAGDVLTFDWTDFFAQNHSKRWRLVGNLPYNIGTETLIRLIAYRPYVVDQHFMLQAEVVERMSAEVGDAAYGRLTILMQCFYHMVPLITITPQAFYPPPKVDSQVVRMLPHISYASTTQSAASLALTLEQVTRVAFSQRRKLLTHTLAPWLAQFNLPDSFDCKRRAQEVPVSAYVKLAQDLIQIKAFTHPSFAA